MTADASANVPADAPRWWHRLSTVRARTTLLSSLAVAVSLGVASLGLLIVLQRSLLKSIDEVSDVRAEDVAALAQQDVLPRILADPGDEDAGVQVVDARGRVVSSTGNLAEASRIANFVPPNDDESVRTLRGVPGTLNESVRVLALRSSVGAEPVVIYVATSLEPMNEILAIVRRILLVGVPVLFLLVASGSWVVVGRALRPVQSIRQEVAEIGATDLGRRVPEPALRDEIGLLARTMNAMLERIQSSTERQRRFVADASHELQSPLASVRSQLEVALNDRTSVPSKETLSDLLEENRRMEQLVQDLLFLARADEAGGVVARATPLDLDDVVLSEIARVDEDRGPHIDSSGVSAAPVVGRRADLVRVVRNLLDNARRHARSVVTIAVGVHNGSVVLTVSDDGPGIPEGERDRIFERFARVDEARDSEHGGTGLGLSIAREIVEQHHGAIEVTSAPPNGTRFIVRLPASE